MLQLRADVAENAALFHHYRKGLMESGTYSQRTVDAQGGDPPSFRRSYTSMGGRRCQRTAKTRGEPGRGCNQGPCSFVRLANPAGPR